MLDFTKDRETVKNQLQTAMHNIAFLGTPSTTLNNDLYNLIDVFYDSIRARNSTPADRSHDELSNRLYQSIRAVQQHQVQRVEATKLDEPEIDGQQFAQDEIEMTARRYAEQGYVGVSNKYRIIVRIDRPDWLVVLATNMRRSVADFFVLGTNKPGRDTGHWGVYYASSYSKDKIEGIDEKVYRRLKQLSDTYNLGYVQK